MVVSLVFVLIFKNDYGYNLYWVITPFLMVLVLMVIGRWSVRGLNVDKEESRVIQRSFDDSTTLSTVFFGIVYLIIQGAEWFKQDITHNQYIIIGFFIVMVVYELFTYLAIYVAKRDTARLLEKHIIRRNKITNTFCCRKTMKVGKVILFINTFVITKEKGYHVLSAILMKVVVLFFFL